MHRLSVLLAEDDPVSALFMTEALQELGLVVECCTQGTAALQVARHRRFDLLVLDCRMPGMGAEEILAALRSEPRSASHASTAVATSAELDATLRSRLGACGFDAMLDKPLDLDRLQTVLQRVLPAQHAASVLDDEAGLRTSGNARALQALRGLFAEELVRLDTQLESLFADHKALLDRLHRLRASCGFCGARALDRACTRLALACRENGVPAGDTAGSDFRRALRSTLDALRERAS